MSRTRRSAGSAPALALAICLVLPSAALAQGASLAIARPEGSWYGSIRGGAVSSPHGEDSWSIYGTLGRYLLTNVALEASVGYYSTEYTYGDVTAWPLALSLKAGLPVARLYPYVIGGVDLQYVDAEIGGRSDDDQALGHHLGAGVEFALSGNAYLGFEYRYTWIEAELFGVTQELDSSETSIMLGVRF